MRRYALGTGIVGMFLLTAGLLAYAQSDKEGCKDHPLLTRMANFYIKDCKESSWDAVEFRDAQGKKVTVEGHLYGSNTRSKRERLPRVPCR